MAAELSIFLLASIPWYLTGAILLGCVGLLAVLLAIRKAETGYEDDTGFHYGTARHFSMKNSRPAKTLHAQEMLSCDHSRVREGKIGGRRSSTKREH
jgi:hypothetical protein